jgi:hypothetical protein
MLDNTSSWGIVRTVFDGASPDFLIEVGSNVGTIKLTTSSKAVDTDKLLINQPSFDNLPVPNDGLYYWVKISHKYSPLEVGTCSVNVNGEVSGINTKFSEVLRGQSTEVPVKIKFYKQSGLLNDQVYEVVSLNNGSPDTELILSGYGFVEESNLNYIVIGSTPIGEVLTNAQLEGLYQYDACDIEFIEESTLDTAPILDFVTDKQFYLARVVNNSGVVTVEDKRTQFLTFNVEGMSSKLDKVQNLADVLDKAAARANLGVLSAAEVESLLGDTGWKVMTKGVAADASNFDMKIRRVGKTCIIAGTFSDGGNTSPNAIIASILYSDLLVGAEVDCPKPSIKQYFSCGSNINNSVDRNIGMFGYVQSGVTADTSLYLKVDSSSGLSNNGSTKFNISFPIFLG